MRVGAWRGLWTSDPLEQEMGRWEIPKGREAEVLGSVFRASASTEQSLQPQVFCFILFCFNSLSLAEVVAQWKRGDLCISEALGHEFIVLPAPPPPPPKKSLASYSIGCPFLQGQSYLWGW